ncbi:SH3 domain-containing protein, partial [Spirochaeta cellobiosiphila]|uniref:SH3 domain-containing protein n=1 Tax=Spirochaeta cellobiosiphila TaxID=504483 RepID=UPI00055BD2EB
MRSFILLLLLLLSTSLCFTQELHYIVKHHSNDSPSLHVGEKVTFEIGSFVASFSQSYDKTVEIRLTSGNKARVSVDDLSLVNNSEKLPPRITSAFWIASYYIPMLNYKEYWQIKDLLFRKEIGWHTWEEKVDRNVEDAQSYLEDHPWYKGFTTLYIFFNELTIIGSSTPYKETSNIFIDDLKSKYNKYTYKISGISNGSSNYDSDFQPCYLSLYNHPTPYDLIFVQDGDYLDMYIDSVNEDNHIFTYARGTKEMAQEIEHFVSREAYDPSKIIWPRHADGTSDYDRDIILNHTTGYSYLTLQNCNLLESPTLNSKAITELNKDEVLTIIQQGKEELIEGVQSHWLKVITDDNEQGWVYGGNVSLNDAVSKTEQEQYKKEHDDLVKLTSKIEKQIERETKKKQLIKNIHSKFND